MTEDLYYFLVVFGVLLTLADGLMTREALKKIKDGDPVFKEANPIARWFMWRIGVLPTIVGSVGLRLGLLYYIAQMDTWYPLTIFFVASAYVVYHNYRIMMKGLDE